MSVGVWRGAPLATSATIRTANNTFLEALPGVTTPCFPRSSFSAATVAANITIFSAQRNVSLTSHQTMDSSSRIRNVLKASSANTSETALIPLDKCLPTLVVVSFYKFADFPDHAQMRVPLKELCQKLRVSGGIILAPEGINGSICGTREAVAEVLGYIESDCRLKGMRKAESAAGLEEEAIHHGHSRASPLAAGDDAPFRWGHVRVKLKKEVVPLGVPGVSPAKRVGKYVVPRDWNALISDPDTMVVDVRNAYEIRIGRFQKAVDPQTSAFRDFPFWVQESLIGPYSTASPEEQPSLQVNGLRKKPSRIAMYCTGGIRCEKATSFLLSKGFEEVYHLKGGILKYLEEVPPSDSLWEGECFVFDKRVSVRHGLQQGSYKLCYACKQPINDADVQSSKWEEGISCPYCYDTKTEEEKERARARQRQFELWGIVGGPHRGVRPSQKGKEQRNSLLYRSKSV